MKVLIIEDDRRIVEIISLALQIRWPEVKLTSTHLGERGIEMAESETPDVIILDLGLPDVNGFEVLKAIRLFSSVPVVILTVMGEEEDIVKGLELGADEYMVKPFRQLELLARIKAIIRRRDLLQDMPPIIVGSLCFGPSMSKLVCGSKDISLTRTEGLVLYHLMRNAGKVVTYSKLAEIIWGDDYTDATESLRVHISNLRRKIEKDPAHPQIICTKTAIGYYLTEPGLR